MRTFPPEIEPYLIRDAPMAGRTSFGVGGPADYLVRPSAKDFPRLAALLGAFAKDTRLPLFILGGGSNIVVRDEGIRGIVLDCALWTGCALTDVGGPLICTKSGTLSNTVVDFALADGLAGLEFMAGLPGTIGGAVWMNARCFDRSVSDCLVKIEILDENGERQWLDADKSQFGYKKSPFQNRPVLILQACFAVTAAGAEAPTAAQAIRAAAGYRLKRAERGHFRFPSAGSVFKNNRAFGKPSGKIIDELGLRGARIGGAQIAPWHGNFIINTGGATAADIRALVTLVQKRTQAELGIKLECEILFI
jgi:UDP-N-acetylmuramate dehydrogenase